MPNTTQSVDTPLLQADHTGEKEYIPLTPKKNYHPSSVDFEELRSDPELETPMRRRNDHGDQDSHCHSDHEKYLRTPQPPWAPRRQSIRHSFDESSSDISTPSTPTPSRIVNATRTVKTHTSKDSQKPAVSPRRTPRRPDFRKINPPSPLEDDKRVRSSRHRIQQSMRRGTLYPSRPITNPKRRTEAETKQEVSKVYNALHGVVDDKEADTHITSASKHLDEMQHKFKEDKGKQTELHLVHVQPKSYSRDDLQWKLYKRAREGVQGIVDAPYKDNPHLGKHVKDTCRDIKIPSQLGPACLTMEASRKLIRTIEKYVTFYAWQLMEETPSIQFTAKMKKNVTKKLFQEDCELCLEANMRKQFEQIANDMLRGYAGFSPEEIRAIRRRKHREQDV